MLEVVYSWKVNKNTKFNANKARKYIDTLDNKHKIALFGKDSLLAYQLGADWQKLLIGWNGFTLSKSRLQGIFKASDNKGYAEPQKPKFIRNIDLKKVINELKEIEGDIVNQDYESAVIVTQEGKMYKIDGTEGFVNINGLSDEQLYGAYMTHNHPSDVTNGSFSSFDISEAMRNKFSVLRAVDKDYICEIKFTSDTIFEKADIINHKFTDTLRKQLLEDIMFGRSNIDIDVDEYHALNELLAKEYKYIYRRYLRNE